jgi:mxaC protein
VNFEHSWVLLLLPLALLPFFAPTGRPASHPWLGLVSSDQWSRLIDVTLRLLTALVVSLLIVGLAAPFDANVYELRVTKGAEIVILFDKSRSMDQPFYTKNETRHRGDGSIPSKGKVARNALAEFVANRPDDRFAMTLFSTFPVPILDFTRNQEVLQAAIEATQTERGLSDTDMARALESSLDYFENRPYVGNRIVLLVSDGGARLSVDERESIKTRIERNKVSLYWIYLRSFRSPGLMPDATIGEDSADSVPEHFLHRYFTQLGTPYRAFEADEVDAMKKAVLEIGKLENSPLRYRERKARVMLADRYFASAAIGLFLLIALRFGSLTTAQMARRIYVAQ